MEKINIAVLDYLTSSVTLISTTLENSENETVEEFLFSEGFHLSNCNWMSSKNEITISDERD